VEVHRDAHFTEQPDFIGELISDALQATLLHRSILTA
jgi:hypothetical protein